ncbi:hypothetical protein EVAR_80673_1 [Eumeta japonica]|uniref:Uncharacterized protein n=1 Tax=Eumeta variegata TaxID=151549 RepID=A0A4C1U4U4_EUMVA|nr:hypothetical protein EVAR_80673_1 [Eumeta japonica]
MNKKEAIYFLKTIKAIYHELLDRPGFDRTAKNATSFRPQLRLRDQNESPRVSHRLSAPSAMIPILLPLSIPLPIPLLIPALVSIEIEWLGATATDATDADPVQEGTPNARCHRVVSHLGTTSAACLQIIKHKNNIVIQTFVSLLRVAPLFAATPPRRSPPIELSMLSFSIYYFVGE